MVVVKHYPFSIGGLMNFKYFLTLIVLVCSSSIYALTGVVKDIHNNPLVNAEVRIINEDAITHTDSLGLFHYTSLSVESNHSVLMQTSLFYKNRLLSLTIPDKKNVSVKLFNVKGQNVMTYDRVLAAGSHKIPTPQLSPGLYVMVANIGDKRITSKFITKGNLSVPTSNAALALSATSRGRNAIDTVVIKSDGMIDRRIPIVSYDEDLGTIVMTSHVVTDYYGLQKYDIDTTLPNYVHVLFRSYDIDGKNDTTLKVDNFIVKENGDPIVPSESELELELITGFDDSTKTILLIDNSKSVESNLDQIKNAAKVMIRKISDRQQIAIYAFSENCFKVQDFTSDTTALLNAIDLIPTGYASTNLYGSLIEVFGKVDNSANIPTRKIKFGNIVLFTDGKDTQGANTLVEVLDAQEDVRVFAVGLGEDLNLGIDALKEIAYNHVYTTTDPNQLGALFSIVQDEITSVASHYYWLHYRSPKRGDKNHTLTLGIEGNTNESRDTTISGTFNSALFTAGWKPTAEDLAISFSNDKRELVASYRYEDKDGEPEGDTKIQWKVNGAIVANDTLRIPVSSLKDNDNITFEVKPVSLIGSPSEGDWASSEVQISFKYKDGYVLHKFASSILYTEDMIEIDDGFIVIGNSDNTSKVFKLNYAGNLLWSRTYNEESGISSICKANNGYILAGKSYTNSNGPKDALFIKIDSDGNIVWRKTYGGEGADVFNTVVSTSSGYIGVGKTNSNRRAAYDAWIVKINENGDTLWTKRLGESDHQSLESAFIESDGIVMGGYDAKDMWLLKINEDGNILFDYIIERKGDSDKIFAIDKASDGYIIGGATYTGGDKSSRVSKINESGQVLWDFINGSSEVKDIVVTKSGYLAGGYHTSKHNFVVNINNLGNSIWTKYLHNEHLIGNGYLRSVKALSSTTDGYVIVGDFTEEVQYGFFATKVDEDGNTLWYDPSLQ